MSKKSSTTESREWTNDEMMTVAAARELSSGTVCFVGIGLPSTAANLARASHAPGVVLIYESGCIGAKPDRLPPSIGDGILSRTADAVISVPEIFAYWLQAGRIDVGFLGAAQVDRFGNINTTVVGEYGSPQVRLPGAGGAPEIATSCSRVIITLRHSPRAMVEKLDFVTSVGHGDGGDFRARLGLPGLGPQAIITDLGVLRCEAETCEFVLSSVHPGVEISDVLAATDWALRVADDVSVTAPPTDEELRSLRNFVGA
jgi:glutaconate CoA-transferase, subunit B